jgi:hypothetical protein
MLSRDIALVFIKYHSNLYARVYWYGEIVTIFLALAVIVETVKYIFPQIPFLKLGIKLARVLGAIAALAAILMMVLAEVTPGGDRVFAFIILAERSAKFVEASWLILVITLFSHSADNWQQYPVGIVAGLGTYAALTLVLFELRTHPHLVSDGAFVLFDLAAYNISAIIWTVFFLRSWRSLPIAHLPDNNVSEWNEVVAGYTQQWYRR